MNQYDKLIAKTEGVHDIVKFLEDKIREWDKNYQSLDYDDSPTMGERTTLVSLKISIEKYEKKLKHQAQEVLNEWED